MMALVGALAFGGWEYATVKTRDATIAEMEAAGAKALQQQAATDAAASAEAVTQLQAKLDAANKAAADFQQRLRNAPTTNSCGPAVRDADRAARGLLHGDAANSSSGTH